MIIQSLNERIEHFKSELTILKQQFGVDDVDLEQKIIGSSLQKFRLLILGSIREHKQTLKNYYEEKIGKKKKKLMEEHEKSTFELQRENIELHKNLEMKEKELIYLSSKLQ